MTREGSLLSLLQTSRTFLLQEVFTDLVASRRCIPCNGLRAESAFQCDLYGGSWLPVVWGVAVGTHLQSHFVTLFNFHSALSSCPSSVKVLLDTFGEWAYSSEVGELLVQKAKGAQERYPAPHLCHSGFSVLHFIYFLWESLRIYKCIT